MNKQLELTREQIERLRTKLRNLFANHDFKEK